MTPEMTPMCAVHPTEAAGFVCTRCGAFGCGACEASTRPGLCVACQWRFEEGSPEGLAVTELFVDSFRLAYRHRRNLGLLSLGDAVATSALSLAGEALQSHVVFSSLLVLPAVALTSVVEAAWIALLASGAHDAPGGVDGALRRGLTRGLPLFLCTIVFSLCAGLGFMACVVPGVVIALGWSVAAPEVVVGGSGPLQGLTRSWLLTSGHRLSLLVAFIAVGGVLLVVALALLWCQVSLGLSLAGILGQALQRLLAAPVVALSVVVWLRLTGRGAES